MASNAQSNAPSIYCLSYHTIGNKLLSLRRDRLLTDCTLTCHDFPVYAHKCVLSASSMYFKSAFCQRSDNMYFHNFDFSENSMSLEQFEQVIDFMYCGSIAISEDNFEELQHLGFYLGVEDLIDACIQYIDKASNPRHCVKLCLKNISSPETQDFSSTRKRLIEALLKQIETHFGDVIEELLPVSTSELKQLLGKGIALSAAVEDVVDFTVRWLAEHSTNDDTQIVASLLEIVAEKVHHLNDIQLKPMMKQACNKLLRMLNNSMINTHFSCGIILNIKSLIEQIDAICATLVDESENESERSKVIGSQDNSILLNKTKFAVEEKIEVFTFSNACIKGGNHIAINAKGDNYVTGREMVGDKRKYVAPEMKMRTEGRTKNSKYTEAELLIDINNKSANIVTDTFKEITDQNNCETEKGSSIAVKTCKRKATIGLLKEIIESDTSEKSKLKRIPDILSDQTVNMETGPKRSRQVRQLSRGKRHVDGSNRTEADDNYEEKKEGNSADYYQSIDDSDADVDKSEDGGLHLVIVNTRKRKQKLATCDTSKKTKSNIKSPKRTKHACRKAEAKMVKTKTISKDNSTEIAVDIKNEDTTVNNTIANSIVTNKGVIGHKRVRKTNCSDSSTSQTESENRTIADNGVNQMDALLDKSDVNDKCVIVHKCGECDKVFKTARLLNLHGNIHSENKAFTCKVCNKSFVVKNYLQQHEKIHSGIKPFGCELCPYTCARKSMLTEHSKKHGEVRNFACDVCDKAFKYRDNLRLHKRLHTGEKPHQCEYCGKSFIRNRHLTIHLLKHPEYDGNLKTRPCPENKDGVDSMGTITKWGDILKTFVCELCAKSYRSKTELNNHLRLHTMHEKYTCKICDRAFSAQTSYDRHMKLHTPTPTTPYYCDQCQMTFKHKNSLTTHMRKHSGYYPFSCDTCSKKFRASTALVLHRRTHTGDKPFVCGVCQRGFAVKANMQVHMRTHTGEKPYRCSICDMTFAHSNTLQGHMRSHDQDCEILNQQKTYRCDLCDVEFSQNDQYQGHLDSHQDQSLFTHGQPPVLPLEQQVHTVEQTLSSSSINIVPEGSSEREKLLSSDQSLQYPRETLLNIQGSKASTNDTVPILGNIPNANIQTEVLLQRQQHMDTQREEAVGSVQRLHLMNNITDWYHNT